MSYDVFGSEVKFNLDGKESFDTCFGAFCSILLAMFVIATFYSQVILA